MSEKSMSDAEAQKEYEEIQAEIAKEKGFTPDKKEETPEKKEETSEPADTENTEEREEKKPLREDPTATDPEDVDPEDKEAGQKVPLSKFQETKKNLEKEVGERDAKIATLTAELAKAKTSKAVGDKVKAYAEEHGLTEKAVLDLVNIVRDEVTPATDPEKAQKLDLFLKKQEAQEKFDTELNDFFTENPEAKEHEAQLRAKAFEKGNLDKSLFEVFTRYVKPDVVEKRKTGEGNRGATRGQAKGFDIDAVLKKVESGQTKPFEGLSDAQIDEVFAKMEKTGSRYTGKN